MLLSSLGLRLAPRIDNRWLTLAFATVVLFVPHHTDRRVGATLSLGNGAERDPPRCIRDTGQFQWPKHCARWLCPAPQACSRGCSARRRHCVGASVASIHRPRRVACGCHIANCQRHGVRHWHCIERRCCDTELGSGDAVISLAHWPPWPVVACRCTSFRTIAAGGFCTCFSQGRDRHNFQGRQLEICPWRRRHAANFR